MRELQVYVEVLLENVTTVGYNYDRELLLCTIMGKESAVIKERTSGLYYLVQEPTDVYKMLRLYYMSTDESTKEFADMKIELVRKASVAYLPVEVVEKPTAEPEVETLMAV